MNKEEAARHLRKYEELLGTQHGYVLPCSATGYYVRDGAIRDNPLFRGVNIWIPRKHEPPDPFPVQMLQPGRGVSAQFAGVHDNLIVTYRRRQAWDNLLHLSTAVPFLQPFGRVIWLGRCKVYRTRSGVPGYRLYIPATTWLPPEPHFRHNRMKLQAIVQTIRPTEHPEPPIVVLHFPALTREFFDVSIT